MDISLFNLANPWRTGKQRAIPQIKRESTASILKWMDEPEILILTGARQVGKTSIVYQLIDNLLKNLQVNPLAIYYFNLDQAQSLDFFENQAALVRFLKPDEREKSYIFIDEIQRLDNPGRFIKGIQDLRLPLKFILTGSSALDIKTKTAEALTGRKKVFHIPPLSFREYLNQHNALPAADTVDPLTYKMYLNEWNEHLSSYCVYGGYPAVALSTDHEKKVERLSEIFSSYLEKDIAGFLKIGNITAFRKLAAFLAGQQGSLVNMDELANTLNINRKTVNNYLEYLEQTFITTKITPFSTNPRSELTKMPKVYFNDPGMRNLAISNMGPFDLRPDSGEIMEGIVANLLVSTCPNGKRINFWRTKTGAEVDFLVTGFHPEVSIEVKTKLFKKISITRGYRSFLKKYSPARALLLNRNLWDKTEIEQCPIEAVPLALFLAHYDPKREFSS
ncbi:MAG: ATP-binding protein [Desulfobulbaceae bacterium]|nr:ATP-binding protein [Desulfobulbaceae bacterium]